MGTHTNQSTQPSRREFIAGAGAALAGMSLLSLGGCDSDSSGGTAPPGSAISFDEEFDVIVAGAGIAGLIAAITVAKEGAGATCLLLEKDSSPNGNSPFCAGYMGYTNDAGAALEYMMHLTGEYTPRDVLKAYCDGMQENLDWFLSVGANPDHMLIGEPRGQVPGGEYPEFPNGGVMSNLRFDPQGSGPKHLQDFLMTTMQSEDAIDYRPSTPIERLIQDPETRAVLGVVANGRRFKANKGVVMCTGGFENDADMMYNYTGVHGAKPYCGIANTGDGHRIAMAAGADFWHMHGGAQFWMACRDLKNERFINIQYNYTNKHHGITVGNHGRRFYQDFDACYTAASGVSTTYGRDDKDTSFIMKNDYRHGLTQYGGRWTHLPFPETAWFIYDAAGLAAGALPDVLATDPVADGWALASDSIEGLAQQTGLSADELKNTVDVWNQFCDDGFDKAFYRPPDTMRRIDQGPFYATLCAPALLNTDGGPVRSAKAEILDPFGQPIDGLYSSGEFGSVWGHLYNGAGNVAECGAFSRIAVREILAR